MVTIHFDRFIDFRREGLRTAWRASHRPSASGAERVGLHGGTPAHTASTV